MYRRFLVSAVAAASLSAAAVAPAAATDQQSWFISATAYGSVTTYKPISKPDFIGATTWTKMPCPSWNGKGPRPVVFGNFWQMVSYDPSHHIGLAGATTDQCGTALFVASPPPYAVQNADLSRYSTARGLHIGSTTAEVVAAYGKPLVSMAACARRCVLGYSATTSGQAVTTGHQVVTLPEMITAVITGGRLSAITIIVQLGGLF
jgi:hypothetical protein